MWFHLMIIGILLFLAISIFNKGETKQRKKIYLRSVFFLLFFISAFRSINIGNDTVEYSRMFDVFGTASNIFNLNTRYELGYVLLNKILYSIWNNKLILFIVTSAFILGSWMKFINVYSSRTWLSVYLFINLRIFYFTLSGLRQSISMAILLISYKYIMEKKLFSFISLVFIASLFHSSAIIFLLVYPLSRIKFNFKFLAVESLVSMVVYYTFETFISIALRIFPQYQSYVKGVYFDGDVRVASIMSFLVIIIILIFGIMTNIKYVRKQEKIVPKNQSEVNLLLHIVSLATSVYFIAINANLLSRIGLYFFMFTVVFIPKCIENIKDKRAALIINYLLLIFALAYNLVILIYRPNWQHVYPYEFFWQLI